MPGQPHEDGCVEIAMLVLILRSAMPKGYGRLERA
jgi:hypothetical protein